MIEFEWFRFRPLTLEDFSSYFETNTDEVKYWYRRWSQEYNNLAHFFYRQQCELHILYEFRKFSHKHFLKLSYPSELNNEEYYQKWLVWQEAACLLQEHLQFFDERSYLSDVKNEYTLMSGKEWSESLDQDMKKGWNERKRLIIKSLWFNTNIRVQSLEYITTHKMLSYNQYLKTTHWKRIRQAKILIEQAKCTPCGSTYSYKYDDLIDLHVHHLHYRNIGCERYEDIRLLCRQHHEELHQENK